MSQISIDWATRIISVPSGYLTPVDGTFFQMDTNVFRLDLKALEASVYGMPNLVTHVHNTEITVAGVTYARFVELINGYSVTFEDGQYSVGLTESNNNIFDIQNNILNQNQVQVIPGNSAGLIKSEENEQNVTNLQFLIESLRDTHSAFGDVFYVDPTEGSDVNNGISPDLAFKTFARAQEEAVSDHSDAIFLVNHGSGQATVNENINITKNGLKIRGPGSSLVLDTSSSDSSIKISADDIEISSLLMYTTGEHCLVEANNCNNLFLQGITFRGGSTAICCTETPGFRMSDCNVMHYNNTGIHINTDLPDYPTDPIRLQNIRVAGGDVGIAITGTVEGALLTDILIRNNNVGLIIGTGIGAVVVNDGSLCARNITNLIDPANKMICQTSIEQSGQVEILKSSDWIHSTQTSGTKPFEDLMTEVLAMGVGRINESTSGVFDFYGQDDTTIIYTLTKSGSQRVRS